MSPLLLAIPIMAWDFMASDGDLVSSGETQQWEYGEIIAGPAIGDSAWATNLSGFYLHDTVDYLEMPPLELGEVERAVLVVRHWYDVAHGDAGTIEIDAGAGFEQVQPIYGYPEADGFVGMSGGWIDTSIDLSRSGTLPRLRFVFTADSTVASDGWFLQRATLFDGDPTPPQIALLTAPSDTQDLDGPYPIQVDVQDDINVLGVTLNLSINGDDFEMFPFQDLGDGLWEVEIGGADPDTTFEWFATATDGSETARWPLIGEESFRVFLAAPQDLSSAVDGRMVGKTVDLTWSPPDSPHEVLAYHVEQVASRNPPVVVFDTDAVVTLQPYDSQVFTVRAAYDVGVGDASEPLSLDVEVPELRDVDPSAAYQGETLYVGIEGASLYMLQGETTLDLGPDVVVETLEVHDVHSATALLTVGADAEVGPRSVAVVGTQGRFSFTNAFEVIDGGEAPRIIAIDPAAVTQGRSATMTATGSVEFAGPVTIEAGDDLVVPSDPVVQGDAVTFELVANTGARVGPHTLVLDDGIRLWTVDIEVREYVPPPSTTCTSTGGPAHWVWLALAGLVALRRRR